MLDIAEDFKKAEDLKSSLLPWLICLSATLFFFYEFIQGNMFASIASNVMQDYHIQADKMTYLSSIYYLANVIFLFVAGVILDRYSIRNTLLIAMFFCVLSTFVLAYSHSFYVAMICRFVMGIGSAFCFLGPVRLASHWFPPQRMALVTGIILTMAMTGGMLAQYPLTKLISYAGWRQAVLDIAWLGVVMFILMYLGIKEKTKKVATQEEQPISILKAAKTVYFNVKYLKIAFYTSLMNMAIAVFGAMMGTLYLEQRLNISLEQASVINGMLFFGAIIGGPLAGWISDRMGVRLMPMKVGALISLVVLSSILYFPVSPLLMSVLFFLLGFFTSAQVISYALVAETSLPSMTAMAVSVISILTQGGFLIYQNLFSFLLTHFGSMHVVNGLAVYDLGAYQYAAIILPLGLLLAFFMLWGLKESKAVRTE